LSFLSGAPNHGRLDLQAVETALRSAMHQAGASALTQLLRYDPPDADRRKISCPCGHSARYKELRSKTLLTVLGSVELRRLITRAPIARKDRTQLMPNWVLPVWNPPRA
jgi:hypothetical protein